MDVKPYTLELAHLEILRAYRQGQTQEGPMLLTHCFRPILCRLVERRLRPYRFWTTLYDEREDVVQNALLRVHVSLLKEGEQPQVKFLSGWIQNCLQWELQDLLRTRRFYEERPCETPESFSSVTTSHDVHPSPPMSALDGLIHRQLQMQLEQCIQQLTQRTREVVRQWMEGSTLSDIAEAYQLKTASAVLKVRDKALSSLRYCMRKTGWDSAPIESKEHHDA